jgi:hypothetical protein
MTFPPKVNESTEIPSFSAISDGREQIVYDWSREKGGSHNEKSSSC